MELVINKSLTTTTRKPPSKPTLYCCNKSSSCGCGKTNAALTSSRVIAGEDAIEDSWPMIVSVRLNEAIGHSCGGTILSNSYVLTAAHCFLQTSLENLTSITIAAGMTNRSDPQTIIRHVDRIYIHPNYTDLPKGNRHDIALLRIDPQFIFESNSSVTKTCIHRIEPSTSIIEYPKNGTRLALIGWGLIYPSLPYLPEVLQQAQVFVIDNQDPGCLNSINDIEIQFCAGLLQGGKG